jgi:hypothetical protein
MGDHVFICYARNDQNFVLELATKLKEHGVPVWIDQWDIPPSTDWDQAIDEAVDHCAHFLIVLSPAAIESREVRGELRLALDKNKPIVPVLYEPCDIPRQLRLIQYVDYRNRGPDDATALAQVLGIMGISESSTPKVTGRQHRTTILEILYEEGARDSLQALDREDLTAQMETSWEEIEAEVNYLEEKGYIVLKKRQIRSRIFSSLYLTAKGVDFVEKGETNEIEALRAQLLKRRSNLQYLQEQAAQYGAGQVPLHLHNQIDLEQQAIDELEINLRELGGE